MKYRNKWWFSYLLIFLFSCTESPIFNSINEVKTFKPLLRSYAKTDTVRFTNDSNRLAVVGLLQGILQADSSKKVPVDILYYVKGVQVSANTDTFPSQGDEYLMHYFEGTDSLGLSCEHFFTINYGYEACGYAQNRLTFYADTSDCYFVTRHTASADGAYGSGLIFYDICKDSKSPVISSVEEQHEPTEVDENIIMISVSDSTIYTFDGKAWTKKLITEKGKVYRLSKEKM